MTATPTGVVTDRMEMMAEIERKSQERVFAELTEGGVDPTTLMGGDEVVHDRPESIPEDEWAGMSDEAKGKAKAEVKPAEEAPETPKVDEPEPVIKTVRIKVDGQETEVGEDKIREAGIRALQKESTADRRLKEATRLLRDAEARQQREVLGSPSKDGGHVAPQSAEDARALAHAIQYGSEDEAAAAIAKITRQEAAPGISPEQIAAIVDNRTQFREAVSWYRKDAQDIASDPILHSVFLQKEQQQIAAGDSRPYQERYQEIAKEIRDWMGTKVPAPQDPLAAKRERKANAPANPTPASVRQPAPQPEKEPTVAETIHAMRRARHQA